MNTKPSSLTGRYAFLHGFYWVAKCALVAYGAVFLQLRGFSAATTGVVMALGTVLAGILLPVLGRIADQNTRYSLQFYLRVVWILLLVVDAWLLFGNVTGTALLVGYLLLLVVVHFSEPFLNAIADFCFRRGIAVNFGISRSIGSLSFAIASFFIGYAVTLWGANSAPLFAMAGFALCLVCLFFLPTMRPSDPVSVNSDNPDLKTPEPTMVRMQARTMDSGSSPSIEQGDPSCSMRQRRSHLAANSSQKKGSLASFLRRYPRYTRMMTGYFFIAVFHTMTETYLLNMMQRIGGDSSSVGTALLIANVAEFVIIFFFERFKKLLSSAGWLSLTAVFFAGKAILFHLAPNVPSMYVFQALQAITYGLYAPAVVHFASEETAQEDAMQGQSLFLAVFTLGSSVGNLIGGLLLERYDAHIMTLVSVLFALVGAAIAVLAGRSGRARLRTQ